MQQWKSVNVHYFINRSESISTDNNFYLINCLNCKCSLFYQQIREHFYWRQFFYLINCLNCISENCFLFKGLQICYNCCLTGHATVHITFKLIYDTIPDSVKTTTFYMFWILTISTHTKRKKSMHLLNAHGQDVDKPEFAQIISHMSNSILFYLSNI